MNREYHLKNNIHYDHSWPKWEKAEKVDRVRKFCILDRFSFCLDLLGEGIGNDC